MVSKMQKASIVRDRSQIMSATKGGSGVCKMLTVADKGGREGGQLLTKGGMGIRQILVMTDKGGKKGCI